MVFQAYIKRITTGDCTIGDRERLTRCVAGGFGAVRKIARLRTSHQRIARRMKKRSIGVVFWVEFY